MIFSPTDRDAKKISFVVGWGQKPNTAVAKEYAAKHNIPFMALEDGFLRSVGLGVEGSPPLSIITDDVGVYYDATAPSVLENLLNDENAASLRNTAMLERAETCMKRICAGRLSKYNSSPTTDVTLPETGGQKRVLVIDQTAGDMSLVKGMMHESGFDGMLEAAMTEHPDAQILIKVHPDVIAGKKKANFTSIPDDDRVHLLGTPMNPMALLEQMDSVYTMTSQMGFEALLQNKTVTCFGAPFYSGWGLTDDRSPISRRKAKRSLAQLFAAAYILYPQYIHPDTGAPGEIEDVIDHLELQRREFAKNRGKLFCFGFSKWKHNHIRAFLQSPDNEIIFCKSARAAVRHGFDENATLVGWGARKKEDIDALKTDTTPVWRIEDGFLRSTSLGSDLTAPASLVIDKRGIYFDPRTESDLEHILNTFEFTEEQRTRAEALRQSILSKGLSKYNISSRDTLRFPSDKTIILVPGQVESDASIDAGCIDIKTNEQLVAAARKDNPDAYIAFKPHPDVVVRNREGEAVYGSITQNANLIIENESISACIQKADKIYTMTSLVGFEALMRKKHVVTFGQPFYSGWGLTDDKHPHQRRRRTLQLSELIYATLIEYPSYINWNTKRFTSPECIVNSLAEEMKQKEQPAVQPGLLHQLKRFINLIKGIIHAK